MEIGFFAFNASSGISMVENQKVIGLQIMKINLALKLIRKLKISIFILPISRWIGIGDNKVTGDAIESISLSSSL